MTEGVKMSASNVPQDMSTEKSFSELSSADGLVRFLKNHVTDHKFLYHFTTAKSLQCILRNRTWRFSSAEKMNDLHEYKVKISSSNSDVYKKIYSTCFSFGDEDNIAMWAMYGIPWEDGIRIRIPSSDLVRWRDEIYSMIPHGKLTDAKYDNDEIIHDVSLHDICYYRGYMGSRKVLTDCPKKQKCVCNDKCNGCPPKALLWGDNSNSNTSIVDSSYFEGQLIGYVKNSAWSYENETRLMFTKDGRSRDYVDLPVPCYILKNMQVSIGPRSTLTIEQVKDMIVKCQQSSTNCVSVSDISDSYYKCCGFLKQLRRHCDKCGQHHVVFNNTIENDQES